MRFTYKIMEVKDTILKWFYFLISFSLQAQFLDEILCQKTF